MANFKAQCLLCGMRLRFLSSRQPVFIFPKREEFHLYENACRLTQGGFERGFFSLSTLYLGRGEKSVEAFESHNSKKKKQKHLAH